ncbi:hypothetical protein [Marinomonas flavescens]|uniref:hypothetical protein n=1 Tax=Marinomonas flavescens TaxID=2529379 RepID=UPI0010568E8A|nr:hypothetical protein [Marinomonas flavescens]
MGTSMSSSGPTGKNPLVPPWAEEGGEIVISDPASDGGDVEVSNGDVQYDIPKPENTDSSSTRFQSARRAFGDYAKSGSRDDLKRSLGHYSRNSTGKGSGAAKRLASGITAGSGLFGLLNGNSVQTSSGNLALQSLSGLTTDQAIDKIVTHLTPNSADADVVRTALNFALSEALQESEYIDDVGFSPELMGEIYTLYITDLVFQQILIDMGRAWFHAETAIRQISMENELRELVRVVVDSKFETISGGDVSTITQDQISQVQASAISETISEWEQF